MFQLFAFIFAQQTRHKPNRT